MSVSVEEFLPEAGSVTMFTTSWCGYCRRLSSQMDREGIAYDVVDITEDADALAKVKSLGYVQAPVVITGEDHWSGFRPDKIKALAGVGAEQRRSAAI